MRLRVTRHGQGQGSRRTHPLATVVVAAIALGCFAGGAPVANAEIGPELLTFGSIGSGAGQVKVSSVTGGGIAADSSTGHVFISDNGNDRIDEFTAWGEFVKAWGWGVSDGSSAELQSCTARCFAGLPGSNPGQIDNPGGIGVAPDGSVYVFERENRRVQVFSPSGSFLRMFGGGVDETTGADICTASDIAGGDECGAGTAGTGPSEFSVEPKPGAGLDNLDLGPDGSVYVGDKDRIQHFAADGSFLGSVSLPEPGGPGSLALDPVSNGLYFAYRPFVEGVPTYKLDRESGALIDPLAVTMVEGIAVDADGDVYVADDPVPSDNFVGDTPRLREFSHTGEEIETCCTIINGPGEDVTIPALATNVVTGAGGTDLYVMHGFLEGPNLEGGPVFVEARGPAPDLWPPPIIPPKVEEQYARAVTETAGTVQARINPNFWADTRYYVEYGTGRCSEGGCDKTEPVPPGRLLGAGIVNKAVSTAPLTLEGLEPGTVYHYRFVASSSGGGPVYGEDPDGSGPEEADIESGSEGTFTTFQTPVPATEECPNEAFRRGVGAALPDCRGYEMVSPVDKLGGDILVVGNNNGTPARLDQSAPGGESITYSSYRSFGDAESAAFTTQYIASRGMAGWATHGISPPREGPSSLPLRQLDTGFMGFSEDLNSGWILTTTGPLLAEGAVPGGANLYRRMNQTGKYEALTTARPIGAGDPVIQNLELDGFSGDGSRTVFRAEEKLTANASSNEVLQVYESSAEGLKLVSEKPGGTAASVRSTAGGMVGTAAPNGREADVDHAVSVDGSTIYWSEILGLERLYVRVDGRHTLHVSAGPALFMLATPDGSKALYTEEESLNLFNLTTESSTPLATEGVLGVLGASKDLSRIYFVSTAQLGGGATAGKPNLYLFESGAGSRFIATLSESDLPVGILRSPSPIAPTPRNHTAYVTADGEVAVFMSRGSLTGVANSDQESRQDDAEVFRYDARDDELSCVSCSTTGVRPKGRELEVDQGVDGYWYASQIPGWEMQLHPPRVLADNGARVFFDSFNALTPRDTNERQDVYEWEAPGTPGGTCKRAEQNGGCLYLISSGKSATASEFVDASDSGRDAFFLTGESLVGWDPGQVDLYDAREGGGFVAPPSARGEECSSQDCQAPAPAPSVPGGNASEAVGPGNSASPPRCRKGFVMKHRHCVKRHHRRHKARKRKRRHHRAKHRRGGHSQHHRGSKGKQGRQRHQGGAR